MQEKEDTNWILQNKLQILPVHLYFIKTAFFQLIETGNLITGLKFFHYRACRIHIMSVNFFLSFGPASVFRTLAHYWVVLFQTQNSGYPVTRLCPFIS